jgi:hypothetical protein
MAHIELGYYGCPDCGTSKAMLYGSEVECNGCGREVTAERIYETASFNEKVAN